MGELVHHFMHKQIFFLKTCRSILLCSPWTMVLRTTLNEREFFFGRGPACIKPIERLAGRLRRVNLMPNISFRQDQPSSGAKLK